MHIQRLLQNNRQLIQVHRGRPSSSPVCAFQKRRIYVDGRARLSNFWVATTDKKTTPDKYELFTTSYRSSEGFEKCLQNLLFCCSSTEDEAHHQYLERAGLIRTTHSGIFHFLPLGVRVLEKLERLIDKHMRSIGACKVSFSSITSKALWQKSQRYDKIPEKFGVEDRKGSNFFLAPTHEEEITQQVQNLVHSYQDTPLRLYQITRKYRDELRPRGGLLRAREFLMKDLYTFDATGAAALQTYEEVTMAYKNFFNELEVPYLVAKADSGAMGGDMSHEYHFLSSLGEDTLHQCEDPTCEYVVNEELLPENSTSTKVDVPSCPQCNSKLSPIKSIEVGHTFHLGTRYSVPFSAKVHSPTKENPNAQSFLEMGCHGIGLSRLISAMHLQLSSATSNVLLWPRKVAPFEIVVVPSQDRVEEATSVYDHIANSGVFDVVLDDRPHKDLIWKLKDADLIGIPIIAVIGRNWKTEGEKMIELQWLEEGKRRKTLLDLESLMATLQKQLCKPNVHA